MKALIGLAVTFLWLSSALAQTFQASFNTMDPVSGDLAPLDSLCGGMNHPIGDGTIVEVWWDRNPAGWGPEDTLAPLCDHAPNCDYGSGPIGTVCFNMFQFNGLAEANVAGTFFSEYLYAYGDIPSPARFYLRVCLGWRIYYSRSVTFAPGEVTDVNFGQTDWTCWVPYDTPCCPRSHAPTGVSASSDTCAGIVISWNGSINATHYRIYRDDQLVGTVPGNATHFLDNTAPYSHPQSYDVQVEDFCGSGLRSNPVLGTRPRATLHLRSPNGGEAWSVFQEDTVRWGACGEIYNVNIELNRNYPTGTWELLCNNTANDGVEPVLVSGTISAQCRVRVQSAGSSVQDISNNNFSIVALQGYVTLVRSDDLAVPVYAWSADTVECPQAPQVWFHLKNFGSESATIHSVPEPRSMEFSLTTNCDSLLVLEPGQMSACSLLLTFDPDSDGAFLDTLFIPTNAINATNGHVIIPLSGSRISPPAAPQIAVRSIGNDIRLTWRPVMQSVGGCPVSVTRYLVYYSRTQEGPYNYHGETNGTSYVHANVVLYADILFYRVVACTETSVVLNNLESAH
jgi:hypothetical protein